MPKNWHRADIVAALHKRHTSLAELARENGKSASALRMCLAWPRTPSNKIVASALGASCHDLWPTWFARDGRLLVTLAKPASRRARASSQKRIAA